jgi:arginase
MRSPVGWELVGVPYTSMATAIAVLRAHGLAGRLAAEGTTDAGDLELLAPDGVRGPSSLLNEAALSRLVEATRDATSAAIHRDHRALVVGGDCPVILGALAALSDQDHDVGLVMLDGHEDSWPPSRSVTGEASDCELGIALGLFSENLPSPLDQLVPLVDPSKVALLGPRDAAELAASGIESVRDRIGFFATSDDIQRTGPEKSMDSALGTIDAANLWLHIDLDVLSSDAFAAVDYPQPGGVTWDQMDQMIATLARDGRCLGASVAIYNPDRDPDRSAAVKAVDFITRIIAAQN